MQEAPSPQTTPAREVDPDSPDVDLAPRIEALKAFLARYPPAEPEPADEYETEEPVAAPAPVAHPVAPEPKVQIAPVPAELYRKEPEKAPSRWEVKMPAWTGEKRYQRMALGGFVAIVVAAAVAGMWLLPSANAQATGSLSVSSKPAGVTVLVDGSPRGVTPVTLDLAPGRHVVELSIGKEVRHLPITITAGGQVSQYLELAAPQAEFGELTVRTEPAGASVIINGHDVGRSPVNIPELPPGEHTVVLQYDGRSVTERVVVESGKTASLVASMAGPPPAAAAGWLSISAPADVQVFENWRLIGTSRVDRIMLPVGRHDLEFVNEALGYRNMQTVQVAAGRVSAVKLPWPQGTLALNAIPWAEVWIDGQMKGETPIGSLVMPIGVHEVVFRHPELGEKRTSVTVTAGKLVKVGVDLGAK
jgi:hypothetical protein